MVRAAIGGGTSYGGLIGGAASGGRAAGGAPLGWLPPDGATGPPSAGFAGGGDQHFVTIRVIVL